MPVDACRLAEFEYRCGDESHHGRTYAFEDALHHLVVLETLEKHGDEQYDDERWQHRAQRGRYRTTNAPDAVARGNRDVHGQDARCRLRESEHVHKLRALDPSSFAHQFLLDDGYHGISPADGKRAYLEKRPKEL